MTTWLRKNPVMKGMCVACGATDMILSMEVSWDLSLTLCADFAGCCVRYRMGMTPDQFSMFHRGVQAVSGAR